MKEIRVCYDLKFKLMRCLGGNGTPDDVHIRLTPSATGAF
jgi:ribonuclease T2